jgi:beta-lactamase regulating signal transducer with metallopeptidase domain/HEAT repeat protein
MTIAIGWVLLHFVWQGVVIAAALGALLVLTSPAQARLRYGLSCAALMLMLGAVLATAGNVLTRDSTTLPRLDLPAGHSDSPEASRSASGKASQAPSSTGAVAAVLTPRPGSGQGLSSLAQPIVEAAMPWLVPGWALGVMLLSVRLAGGWWRTRTLRVEGVFAVPTWCRAQLGELSARLAIARPVAIVASARVSVPVVLGHLKPVIILPAAVLAGLSPAQVEAIVAHELAHVRRHDYLVNLAQTVIETLFFYHPAVWWVSRQVRVAREHCCDDLAVTVCGSRAGYVRALLGLEELRRPAPLLALAATSGSLLARARRLLVPAEDHAAAPRLAASIVALTVLAVAAAGVPFAAEEAALVERSTEEGALPDAGPAGGDQRQTPSTAEEGPAVPVIVSPETTGTLASRWTWAEGAVRPAQRARYWIGYTVTPVRTLPPFVYIDRSATSRVDRMTISGHILSSDAGGMRFPGRPLALPPGDRDGLKMLFGFDTNGGANRLSAVHISTSSLPVDTKGVPVYWLGSADAAQSLERVDALYGRAATVDLKNDLVAAAGVHDASPAVVAWLERRVASRDPDSLRGDAAEWIAWHPIAASITALDRIARTDRASHVRQEAAEALGDVAMPEAATALIALAQSLEDVDARREAVEALGARPELEARDALGAIARTDASVDIQREAVETLGDFEDQRGVLLLMELARAHPRIDVRREAVETLGDALPDESVVAVLEELAMKDPDPGIQEEAIETLAGLEDAKGLATLMALAQSHPRTSARREAIEALADGGSDPDEARDSSIVDLLEKLARDDGEIDVQLEAVETLGEIPGAAAAGRLRELARAHPDERVRAEVIESLGSSIPAAEAASFLQDVAIAEKSSRVQEEAIEALAGLDDGAGINALLAIARDHPAASARKQALEALLESDHPRARDVFRRALEKPVR